MNIPDEMIEAVTGMHPEEREYPEDVRRDFVDTARWARKEALREARAAIAELLADPGIYTTAAIAGVTSALAKLDGVPL